MTRLADRASSAVADENLQTSLRALTSVLRTVARHVGKDPAVADRRAAATRIRQDTVAELDRWVAEAEQSLVATGCVVHHAATRDDAVRIIRDLALREQIRLVVKGKSMATEEMHLNPALEAEGIEVVETDLGEYIVQLAHEPPSHIVGPALHKRLPEITELFSQVAGRQLPEDPQALCTFARVELRDKFLAAGMGITGANFVAADTGTIVLVTNEGNGRMCSSLPRIHVAVVPVEKVVPRLADVPTLVGALVSAATGQPLTTYVSMITGPRHADDVDGPEELHVVFLDHGRRRLVGTKYQPMLACVRCGACLNACPVYAKIGGHAYDSVYSGPMGVVLTPLLSGRLEDDELVEASSLCGACTEACPVGIPLADLIVHLRADLRTWPRGVDWPQSAPAPRRRPRGWTWNGWARVWSSPAGYRISTGAARRGARTLGRGGPWVRRLPGAKGWAAQRDVPVPAARSFRSQWRARQRDPRTWGGLG